MSVIVNAPEIDPVTEGVNVTEMVQVSVGCIVWPAQVSVSEKSPLTLTVLMLRLKLPEFVSVMASEVLDWPTKVLVNFKLDGARPATGKTDGANPQKLPLPEDTLATKVAAPVAVSNVYTESGFSIPA